MDCTCLPNCECPEARNIVAAAIADVAAFPLRVGMLFYHEFNEGALGLDSTGNGYHLTEVNSPITVPGVPAIGGTAVGGGGVATMAHLEKTWHKNIYDMSRNSWTMSYWYNRPPNTGDDWFGSPVAVTRDGQGGAVTSVFTFIHQGNTFSPLPVQDEDTERVQVLSNLSPEEIELSGNWLYYTDTERMTLPTSTWHHVAVSWNATKQSAFVYIDGVANEPENVFNETINDFFHGALPDDPNWYPQKVATYLNQAYQGDDVVMRVLRGEIRYMDGFVDEFAMCDRMLSQEEITALSTGLNFQETLDWTGT